MTQEPVWRGSHWLNHTGTLPSPDGLLANFKEQKSKFITMLGPVRYELD